MSTAKRDHTDMAAVQFADSQQSKKVKTHQNTSSALSTFTAAQLAAISAASKYAGSSVDLATKFREQSKGESATIKFVVRNVSNYDSAEAPSLEKARLTVVPIFDKNFTLPASYKTIKITHEPVAADADPAAEPKTRVCVTFYMHPNKNSRTAYDDEWGAVRTPLKHLALLVGCEQVAHVYATADNTEPAASAFAVGVVQSVHSLFANKQWKEAADAAKRAIAAAKLAAQSNVASPLHLSYDELRASPLLAADLIASVDAEYGADKLPESYEIKMYNGCPVTFKLPKKKCENVSELLNVSFGDIVELEGLNFSAWAWDMSTKSVPMATSSQPPWPKRATLNTFAARAVVYKMNPTTLFHAFNALHDAAPASLAHPVLQTIFPDVYSLRHGQHVSASSNSDNESAAALNSMASVLKVTQSRDNAAFVQRAGLVTKVERFVEDTEERMLTSNRGDVSFIALKSVIEIMTWWPTNNTVQTFSVDESFAYLACLQLRAYEEHIKPWLPIGSIKAWTKLAPSLMRDFVAFYVYSRNVEGAFAFEATRKNEHSFRAAHTTNERRLGDVQTMEVGYVQRIAIDFASQLRKNGVPLSSSEVSSLFAGRQREVPRVKLGDTSVHSSTSSTVVAVNELSDADFAAVLGAPPGTYAFYAVSSSWTPSAKHAAVFAELHSSGAIASGAATLAGNLFARTYTPGDQSTHELVDAAQLEPAQLGEPTYVFAVNQKRDVFEREVAVRKTLCKLLGYDEDDPSVSIDSICTSIADQAASADAFLLPSLQRIVDAEPKSPVSPIDDELDYST